ncbi:OB-fold-containig protein [Zavarzinia compransoris]|uniref:DUF1449 domain-containing protein n=1 Tax=Zavarzinia compransoris TaxID=1264899 RepID=A0A317E8I2_9PROT|nr:OB-fold-containig protein [Zavarzinia compransoris]PWR23468.1 hypothetical protein DKG75_02540 [Zavarzinia compransoris]TDP45952.1 uncharacterized protein DUF1449 [Zavarzinia compransoris]
MLETLLAPANQPFAVAIGLLLGLLLIEVLGTVTGHRLGDHGHDHEIDADGEIDGGGALDWIGLGKVPLVVLLAEFCAAFASFGLILQAAAGAVAGPLPAWAAALAVLVPTVFATRWLSIGIARILPREETAAVSIDSLVGRIATIGSGTARSGNPAEAKVKDQHGHIHYVRVHPATEGDVLPANTRIVLLARAGGLFTAARLPDVDDLGGKP